MKMMKWNVNFCKGKRIMRKFRKITVNNLEYKWLFQNKSYDNQKNPYLLIVAKDSPKTTLHINFPIKEHFLLNCGIPAAFHGQQVSLNLNQPFFISQIVQWCSDQEDLFKQTGYQYLNGSDILKAIGYELFW